MSYRLQLVLLLRGGRTLQIKAASETYLFNFLEIRRPRIFVLQRFVGLSPQSIILRKLFPFSEAFEAIAHFSVITSIVVHRVGSPAVLNSGPKLEFFFVLFSSTSSWRGSVMLLFLWFLGTAQVWWSITGSDWWSWKEAKSTEYLKRQRTTSDV